MQRLLSIFVLIVIFTGHCLGQSPQDRGLVDDELNARAVELFTDLLLDKDKAQNHISELRTLTWNTTHTFPVVLGISHQLLSWKYPLNDVKKLLAPCMDAAAALPLSEKDKVLPKIACLIGRMQLEKEDTLEYLKALEELGLPVFSFLAEASGVKRDKVISISREKRLRPKGAGDLILEGFEIHYGGAAAKLAAAPPAPKKQP
jgi:hypothetical protein